MRIAVDANRGTALSKCVDAGALELEHLDSGAISNQCPSGLAAVELGEQPLGADYSPAHRRPVVDCRLRGGNAFSALKRFGGAIGFF